MPPTVSIIIPALNEEGVIESTLESLGRLRGEFEVVVVDGGSRDSTVQTARSTLVKFKGSKVIRGKSGRGLQLNQGADVASGEVLVFLHADTVLPSTAVQLIKEAMRDPKVVGGNFRMVCGGSGLWSKLFTRINAARRWFGIYYGDSVIWVRRTAFEGLGGFLEAPLMEDYHFCRKLERAGQTVCLNDAVVTSPRRWAGGRVFKTMTAWVLIQWLYLIGVNPARLGRLYPSRRERG